MYVPLGELLPPVQERQLENEGRADDFAAELLDELADRLDGPARGEHVVVYEHPCPRTDRVRMHLERVLTVLERIGRAHDLRRKLPGAAGRNEAAADLGRDRRAEDEPARLGAEYEVRPPLS